ncbi:hypothetical protein, partial [Shigella sonnei]
MFPDFFMHIGQALDLVSRYDRSLINISVPT